MLKPHEFTRELKPRRPGKQGMSPYGKWDWKTCQAQLMIWAMQGRLPDAHDPDGVSKFIDMIEMFFLYHMRDCPTRQNIYAHHHIFISHYYRPAQTLAEREVRLKVLAQEMWGDLPEDEEEDEVDLEAAEGGGDGDGSGKETGDGQREADDT